MNFSRILIKLLSMRTIYLDNKLNKVIEETIRTLEKGGVVIFPSDTVYGLLVNAINEKAVQKLIAFKNRPTGKAISVFCDFKALSNLVKIDRNQKKILKNLLPGPFTVILDS